MRLSRFYPIPRFALPYTPLDCLMGLLAILRGAPPPDAFDLLGNSPKMWTRSGRQALRLLLIALDLPPRSGVAVPLFTDPSLVSAIVSAGHHPVFIDIDPRYFTIDPESLAAARGKFSAVVVVHLFGHMADMPELLEVAKRLPVIEDAAHAPLSYLNGRMAGNFGSACFYSFASTKYWPAGGGGIAVLNDATLVDKVARLTQPLSSSSAMEELRHLVLQSAKAAVFSRVLYGLLGKPLRRWVEKWGLLEPSLNLKAIQRPWAEVARRQASRFQQRVEQQRANSLYLLSQLADVKEVVLPQERPGARHNYHLFPVLLQNSGERRAMMSAMWAQFVDTSMIYSDVIQRCRNFGYRGGCPVAELVAERLITIPNHAALARQDIDRVAEVFLSSLAACRKSKRLLHAKASELLDVARP